MRGTVPFLPRAYIESEAEGLLAAYSQRVGRITRPPIPADEILNVFLGVRLDFDDLPNLLGIGTDVFGATWIERGQVIIDENLDPTNHPEMIGRYNFTVGHETGHWQLHRPYLLKNAEQQALFEQEQNPTVVCRTSEAKDPIEWQADFFSSCLLMPKEMLEAAWHVRFGSPISLAVLRERQPYVLGSDSDDLVIERSLKPLARAFAVSPSAMRIRAENIGLVVREDLPNLFATRNKERNFG